MPSADASWMIRAGDVEALLGSRGGGVRKLVMDGVVVIGDIETDAVPLAYDGLLLAPWPNRIVAGTWSWQGEPQQLPISEPETGSALHGLVAWSAWRPERIDVDAVELAIEVLPQPGYPFHLDLRATWRVSGDGLRCRLSARNIGLGDAPFGIAAHPYIGIPGCTVDELVLSLPANVWMEVDTDLHPVALHSVQGTSHDFRTGAPLAGVCLDTAFTERVDTEPARITGAGGTVEMWADAAFKWWQVYTSDYFPPGSPRRRSTVALEPMTCGPNAFNTGRDVVVLSPGDEWVGEWGVRYRAA